MATLEKPKVRTKKAKKRLETTSSISTCNDVQPNAILENVSRSASIDINTLAHLGIETEHAESAASAKCLSTTDFLKKTEMQNETSDERLSESHSVTEVSGSDLYAEESIKTESKTVSANVSLTPTAPHVSTSTGVSSTVGPVEMLPIVQYPNLLPLQYSEAESILDYQTKNSTTPKSCLTNSELRPLTIEQQQELYHCAELDMIQQFELDFLMNSLLETYENDALYVALLEYWHLQSKLTVNNFDVENAKTHLEKVQAGIWKEVPVTRTFSAMCRDRVVLKENVTYNVAEVNGKNLECTSAAMKNLSDLTCNTYATNLINAKITKVKINQMIDDLLSPDCLVMLAQNKTMSLQRDLDAAVMPYVADIRRSISILFSFMRKLSPNKDFTNDLKVWLRKLIALYLLIATKEDHWFILFNILRCPSGVGNWATEFFQIPDQHRISKEITSSSQVNEMPMDLNSPEINHCMAALKILLLPIKKRNEYLKDYDKFYKEIMDPAREEHWTLIDSDGEDSNNANGECVGLKESDLIALLNQIPLEKLFVSALKIEKFLNDYIISPDHITANDLLRIITFFSKLVEIFGDGMVTYNTERYKQLAKRLGRLIRHTLQYSTDYYELFMNNKIPKQPKACERISVELNALLLKGCNYIYRSRNLATWQYFSTLPFHSLDTEILWKIFYYLNVGFPAELAANQEDYEEVMSTPDFWQQFHVANADSSAEDLYYLLQAFFAMANERDRLKDFNFIKTVCLHIFNIGFVNTNTREICYKTARDMLVNLTLAYEELITYILFQLKIRFGDIENGIYLIKSLPLENWKPGMDSFELLSNWLLQFDYTSHENQLARIVISNLNWWLDCDGRLFLPHNIHVRMACLVTEALNKHAPEVIGLSGITESVRQVSSLIDSTQTTKEQFSNWCWTMVSLLRLHIMDLGTESIKRTLRNPTEHLMFIPELEHIEVLYQGVTENRPLSVYVAILSSLHGHSIPLICQRGLELMKLLLSDYRHVEVIRCIELIVPLFLESPETLANCKSFHAILNSILSADSTYLKMAKDIIYPNSIGPVIGLLDNMIHHQITSYTDYGLSTPMSLINAWLNLLTGLPLWQCTQVVYLLDRILRIAYQFSDARQQSVEFFQNLFKGCSEWKGPQKMSTLKTIFGNGPSRIPSISPLYGWMALTLLEIEFKTQEAQLWPEFLRQLALTNGRGCVETAFKKTATALKLTNTFPPQMLVMYKYANLVASMDISHPVYPVICQKFFELYLSRVPVESTEYSFGGTNGVSDKFYDYNVTLMKKVSNNLKAADTFYANEATKRAGEESLGIFYSDCSKIMKSYQLWLHETNINQQSKDNCNLPPQYNNQKLREIFHGNTSHWTEFLYLPDIRKMQKDQAQQWQRKCFRIKSSKHLRSPLPQRVRTTATERIKQHLSSYDASIEAPKYLKPNASIPKEITKATFEVLEAKLKTLNSMANKFYYDTNELNSLNRNYLDVVRHLYKMVTYEEIKMKNCDSILFNRQCSGPARIATKLEQIRIDNKIEAKLKKFEERRNKIINGILKLNAEEFAGCVQELNGIVRILITTISTQANAVASHTGIQFYYTLVKDLNEITMNFQPTNDLYSQLLYDLNIFIQENQQSEGIKILELALKRADLIKQLAAAFVPYRTGAQSFLEMYKFLVESYLKRCDNKILFVLFSKFDLVSWLESVQPKLNEIHKLLELVLQGLECWSQPDSTLLQDQFRRHLVHIFDYDFPQHYGEVLQMVLDRAAEQKVTPNVLLDLLNALIARFNCKTMTIDTSSDEIVNVSIDFARRQNLFNLKGARDTILLFARHFQKERLNHGLHGLYPKHKEYCKPLAMWFSCIGHVLVVAAICSFQDRLADQISDVIFASIIELFSPWLVPYTEDALQQSTANWIRQLTAKDKILSPWTEQYAPNSKLFIKSLMDILNFLLESLPVSHVTLTHIFGWYLHHYAIPKIDFHIYANIHEGMAALPWELFKPQPAQIDLFHENLQKFLPATHAMLGHIFMRINWNAWFEEIFPTVPSNVQSQGISRLFAVFVKIAFEPNIHVNARTVRILEDAIKYPWYRVNYAEIESIFQWFLSSVDYPIILKIPTETDNVDKAVLELLRLSCAMMPEEAKSWKEITQPTHYATAKRILYTRNYVRLLSCTATKHHKLIDTKEGTQAFNVAFNELLNTIDRSIRATEGMKTIEEQQREALNLMVELVVPMQTQRIEISNQLIDTMIHWQSQCNGASFMHRSTISALGHMKTFVPGVYPLLESSIVHYFRLSNTSNDLHTASWKSLGQLLTMSIEKLNLMPIMNGPYLLTLHYFFIYKIKQITDIGDKITYLQDTCQLVEGLKPNPHTEQQLALVWGAIIASGCQILCETNNVKKVLLMFASDLCLSSTQAEGWGDTLLGVIGLKTDFMTNNHKTLARCLACVIYSLFPQPSSTGPVPNEQFELALRELTNLLTNKKFTDVKSQVVTAIGIIKDERTSVLRDIPHLVHRLINVFYSNDFLTTVLELWEFESRT